MAVSHRGELFAGFVAPTKTERRTGNGRVRFRGSLSRNPVRRAGLGTWLYRIATNCSLDLLRRQKLRGDQERAVEFDSEEAAILSDAAAPDQQVYHGEVRQKVESVMRELTPMERTAFVLRHFEGLSIGEIGSALGVGPGATKQSIFRAVQKMRRALEPVVNATP